MSGQKFITTHTILYAIVGFFVGLVLAWFIGWASVPYLRSIAATGFAFVIYGGLLVIIGLWALSLIPSIKTPGVGAMKGMPLSAFLWSMWLAILLVLLGTLFMGLTAFGF